MIVKNGILETLDNENNHPCESQKNITNTSFDYSSTKNLPDNIKDSSTKCLENTSLNEKGPFTSTKCLENSFLNVKDPFTSTKCLKNTPDKVKDPFTSTKCLENTPDKVKYPFTSTKCLENTPDKVKDPFTSTKCLENTPVNEKDPFASNKCVKNTPDKIKDPFTSTKCLENTPDKLKDPFTSTKCLENTPDKVKDPFASNKCLKNTPEKVKDPFTSTKCIENTPDTVKDPFTSSKCLKNTLDNVKDPFTSTKCLENTSVDLESTCNEINKFKTPEKIKKSKAFDFCVNSSNFNVLSGSPSSLIKKSERTKNIIQNNVTNPHDFEEFRSGAELLNEGFEFDLDFLANKGETVLSRDLRKESLYVKFDPFVSDSPRRRTNAGRPSDIIDFSDNRKSMIKQRVISLNNDLSAETKPEIQTEPRCLLDMNSYEDVDVTVMDGNTTVIGPQQEDKSVLADGDQLIEIPTFSQTQLTLAVEKACEPLLEKIKQLEQMNENLKTEHGFEMQQVKDENKNVSAKEKNKFLSIEKKIQQVENNLKTNFQISNEHTKMKSSYETKFKKYQEQNEHLKSALAKSEDNHFSLYQRSKSMQEQLNKYKKNESAYKESFKRCSEKNANLVVQFNEMKHSLESQLSENSEQSKKRVKALESQNNAYKIKIRSLESKAKSAETALEQKTKECQELNQLCEEMFAQQNS